LESSPRSWMHVLAAVALPLVIVLAIVLGVLAALVFYVRALVVAVVHLFQRREEAHAEAQPPAGNRPAAAPIVRGEPGASAS
jgi:hypothetical protein